MKFFGKMKIFINKYIRKYIAVACSLLLIPIFSVNSYAYQFYENMPFQSPLTLLLTNSSYTQSFNGPQSPKANIFSYHFTNAQYNSCIAIAFGNNSGDTLPLAVNTDLYDYYCIASVYTSSDAHTFFPEDFKISAYTADASYANAYNLPVSDLLFYNNAAYYNEGFSVSCKVDLSTSAAPSWFEFVSTNPEIAGNNLVFQASFIGIEKSASEGDTLAALITAINNQTSELASQLGDIDSGINKGNDLIENGTDETQQSVTDFNEVFDDFNAELDAWEEFDDAIIGEFNNANENYKTELNNFSLSDSLLNAGTWLSTSMQTVYNNSSDYKMLWLVPLLFGIPILLFIIRKNGDDE